MARGSLAAALGLTVALSLLAPAPAAAGPWVPEPGHGYAKVWLKYLYGFQFADGSGETAAYAAYHDLFLAGYAEVGVVERVALVAHWEAVRSFYLRDPTTRSTTAHLSAGDPMLGARVQLVQAGRFVLSTEVGVRLPFAPGRAVQDVRAAAAPNEVIGALRTGTGVVDVPVGLSAGYGWDRGYVAVTGTYLVRTGGYDHVWTWSAEGGGTLDSGVSLRARVTGWHPVAVFFDERAEFHRSPNGIGNGTQYVGFALEGDVPIADGWVLGGALEGGVGFLRRQTGGPVLNVYVAASW